ncbi:hypothetical protein A1O3_05585 [Capronia epimyces CBS 606.96]|uniref:protein S-acyltransferase n=1 Tax=Capronia epimyces CBS 606.96 TaxID=1182542 RepID=W9Y5M1_9EURO|nr:uncharacterized protein A1O3_05585 [Capronia epimyces CBS 606.96]EXJ84910.1 hypothetical protein A1O3_05585 [Capronia epimyces CBS 606.96]
MAEAYHSPAEWKQHLNLIAQLYIRDGLSHDQIAHRLSEMGFTTSGWSIKARLQKWKIKRIKPQEELWRLARCFLYHRGQGQTVGFKRWGEDIPNTEIEGYIKQNPSVEASDEELPGHLELVLAPTVINVDDGTDAEDRTSDQPSLAGAAQTMVDTSAGIDQTDGRPTKKRKSPSNPSLPYRPESSAKQPRDTGGDEHAPEADNTRSKDDDDDDQSTDRKKREMEKALSMLRTLSRQLPSRDKKYADAVSQVEQLFTSALEEESPEQESTDLGPLHWAARNNDIRLAKLLLDKGADLNARGGKGFTALHTAAVFGHLEVLRFLLFQDNLDIDAVDNDGATALMCAVAVESSLECALLLLQKGADPDIGTTHGRTALHYACTKGGMDELVKMMAKATSKLDSQDDSGETALHLAIRNRNEDYVVTLMEAGASVDVPDEDGRTAMHEACFHGSPGLLMRMIDHGADLAVKGNQDETVLHIMSQRPDLCHVARTVAQKPGVDINAKSRLGSTPLILAAANKCYDTVRMLVGEGADVHVADEDMDTALTIAVRRGHAEIAEFLIESGSPLNPHNQSRKKWKAKLEHNRRVQQALSVPTSTRVSSTKGPRTQPSHAVTGRTPPQIGISPLEIQALQNTLTRLAKQVGGQQSNHPLSPRFGAGPSYASASSLMLGNNPNSFTFNAQPPSNHANPFSDPFSAMGLNSTMDWEDGVPDSNWLINIGQ